MDDCTPITSELSQNLFACEDLSFILYSNNMDEDISEWSSRGGNFVNAESSGDWGGIFDEYWSFQADSVDRALTMYKSSGGDQVYWDFNLQNTSGQTITSFTITYDLEVPWVRTTGSLRTAQVVWQERIAGGNPVSILGSTSPILNNQSTSVIATSWLTDAQMDAANLSARRLRFLVTNLSLAPGDVFPLRVTSINNNPRRNMNHGIDNLVITTNLGTTTILTVADGNNNSDDCSVDVDVFDVTAPQLTGPCPENQTITEGEALDYLAPTYVDNCTDVTVVRLSNPDFSPGSMPGVTGTPFQLVYVATDAVGNTNTDCKFSVTVNENPALPVALANFSGKVDSKGVTLFWETSTESDNEYFTLLRSGDGQTFAPLATVPAGNYPGAAQAYTYLDEEPGTGTVFYQLTQTDLDGQQRQIGTIVQVQINCCHGRLIEAVYPNPVQQILNIRVPQGNSQSTRPELRLLDASGQQKNTSISVEYKEDHFTIDLGALPVGLYFLEIRTGGLREVERIVKQ
ncbi:hypothetical protein A3850_018060 [Lewinella sp. 4G2]|nr:hypothetical protein A3850_018060 [Lewinella sp. 4G2]